MPKEKDFPMTLNTWLGLILIAIDRNSPGEAQKEKQALRSLLFSVAPTLVTGLTRAQSCHTGEALLWGGTSSMTGLLKHSLEVSVRTRISSCCKQRWAAQVKPLKESQVGDNPSLYHSGEVSFSYFKSSCNSSSFFVCLFCLIQEEKGKEEEAWNKQLMFELKGQ